MLSSSPNPRHHFFHLLLCAGSKELERARLNPFHQLSDNVYLQQYDQYGKCHSIKILHVTYKERPSLRTDRVTEALPNFIKGRITKCGSINKTINEDAYFIKKVLMRSVSTVQDSTGMYVHVALNIDKEIFYRWTGHPPKSTNNVSLCLFSCYHHHQWNRQLMVVIIILIF